MAPFVVLRHPVTTLLTYSTNLNSLANDLLILKFILYWIGWHGMAEWIYHSHTAIYCTSFKLLLHMNKYCPNSQNFLPNPPVLSSELLQVEFFPNLIQSSYTNLTRNIGIRLNFLATILPSSSDGLSENGWWDIENKHYLIWFKIFENKGS